MKTLFASSEIFPYAKSGGLADVASSLPKELKKEIDIVSVMPFYGFMDKNDFLETDINYDINLGGITYKIEILSRFDGNVSTYFIKAPLLSDTKNLYGDDKAYANNDIRFGIFSKAVSTLALLLHVKLVHLNDWHCALSAFWLENSKIKTVFTIHNLAYQGVFEKGTLERLGIGSEHFNFRDLEFWGKCNFMKAGIRYADAITTVSPSYAKEILTPKFGFGLDGFLNFYKDKLSGILNGINTDFFNPKTDKALFKNYDKNSLALKKENKKTLFKKIKLKDENLPLFVMISRLVEQKGFDIILDSLDDFLQKRINLIILTEGESRYKKPLAEFAKKYENFELIFGYDESLSHQLYASCDFLLMPSLFEPCGLNQMIAMRYGTIPIVHNTGGLEDSVHEKSKKCGMGIIFSKPTKRAFMLAVDRALKLKNREVLQKFDMQCDFSFAKSAQKYIKLYKKVLL
ncbi:MAG: glycogen/starch synthase [Sulfurospirillum sp.]